VVSFSSIYETFKTFAMKTLGLTLAFVCLYLVHFGKTYVESTSVFFDSDKYAITESERLKITDFVSALDLSGDYEFQITGHTDHEGSHQYNRDLSQKRAQTVLELISSSGVPADQCTIEWFGETKLLSTRKDVQSKAKNRRVEILFKRYSFETVEELIDELSRSTKNKFLVDAKSENLLVCSGGTKLAVKENAFLTSDSTPYSGNVLLEVTEALHSKDFLKNGLATVCDGRILKSGGMVKIVAKSENGKELLLRDNDQISMALPTMGSPQQGFELFTSDNGQDWVETNQKPLNQYALDIPPRPYLKVRYVRNNIPQFDESTKPHKPIEPVYPRQPTKPRWESYEREIRWYQFLSANDIRQRDSLNYEDAMMRYRKRMAKYEVDITVFEDRCSKYPADLELYYKRLAAWNQEKAKFLKEQEAKSKYIIDPILDYDKAVQVYKKELKEWESLRDKAEAEYLAEMDKLGVPQDVDLSYFVFRNTGLGWANCDRFYSVPEEAKMDLTVAVPDFDDYKVYLVFHGERIVLPLRPGNENNYLVENIPSYLLGTIVSYKIEDGKILYAEAEFQGQRMSALQFEHCKVSDLKKKLNKLGNEFS
jgi:hypothetical protein